MPRLERTARRGLAALALLLSLALLTSTAATLAQEAEPQEQEAEPPPPEEEVRKDRQGDPLPAQSLSRVGTLRFRGDARLKGLVTSPGGRWMATLTEENTLEVWDSERGQRLFALTTEDDADLYDVAFSPDEKLLAAATSSGVARWSLPDGAPLEAWAPSDQPLRAVAFGQSRRDRWLAAGGDDKAVYLWNLDTEELERTLDAHQGPISDLSFDPGGGALISASQDGTWIAWSPSTGRQGKSATAHSGGPVFAAAVHPNGKTLATSGNDDNIHLWDLRSGRQQRSIKCPEGAPTSLVFDQGGAVLAGTSPLSPVQTWDARSGRLLRNLKAVRARAVAFSGDGQRLFAAGRGLDQWDVRSGTDLLSSLGHRGHIVALAFTQQGNALLTAGADRGLFLWEASTGYQLQALPSRKPLRDLDIAQGTSLLAYANEDSDIHLFDLDTGQQRHLRAHSQPGTAVAFSRGGQRLATGAQDATILLWDPATGQQQRSFLGSSGRVRSLHWSGDGRMLASSLEAGWFDDKEESVVVWHARNGSLLFRLPFPADQAAYGAAFSPDGAQLATVHAGGGVHLYDVLSSQRVASLQGHSGDVYAVAFSPDGRRLATAGADGLVLIWDIAQRQQIDQLEGHKGPIRDLAFSPDGLRLASASDDTTVLVWQLSP